jgi:hypothetical protein
MTARLSLAQNLFGSLVDAGRVWPMGSGLRLLCVLIHASLEVLFLSFIVGLGVGVLYGLIRVKSPYRRSSLYSASWGWCIHLRGRVV